MFINVGAKIASTGAWIATKKALKEMLRDSPADVVFVRTSMFDEGQDDIKGDHIPQGPVLSVVGPDPYNRRVWYGSVWRHGLKITVK